MYVTFTQTDLRKRFHNNGTAMASLQPILIFVFTVTNTKFVHINGKIQEQAAKQTRSVQSVSRDGSGSLTLLNICILNTCVQQYKCLANLVSSRCIDIALHQYILDMDFQLSVFYIIYILFLIHSKQIYELSHYP